VSDFDKLVDQFHSQSREDLLQMLAHVLCGATAGEITRAIVITESPEHDLNMVASASFGTMEMVGILSSTATQASHQPKEKP